MAIFMGVIGACGILAAIVIVVVQKSRAKLSYQQENARMAAFLLGYFGIWMLLFSGFVELVKKGVIFPKLSIWQGALAGLLISIVPNFINFAFWLEGDSRYAHKSNVEEGIGGAGCAVLGCVGNAVIGVLIGAILGICL